MLRQAWPVTHKSSFYVHPPNRAEMAAINNSSRRPGGQILYCSYYYDTLIAVLGAFCLHLNCETKMVGLFCPVFIYNCFIFLLFKIEYEDIKGLHRSWKVLQYFIGEKRRMTSGGMELERSELIRPAYCYC